MANESKIVFWSFAHTDDFESLIENLTEDETDSVIKLMKKIGCTSNELYRDGVRFCSNKFTKDINKNYKLILMTNVQTQIISCMILKK